MNFVRAPEEKQKEDEKHKRVHQSKMWRQFPKNVCEKENARSAEKIREEHKNATFFSIALNMHEYVHVIQYTFLLSIVAQNTDFRNLY